MRNIILLLALSATVLTLTGIITTKAKSENMTHKLKTFLGDDEKYENPWIADAINGECQKGEVLYSHVTDDGTKLSQCMPPSSSGGQCPKVPLFDKGMDAYQITYNGAKVCTAECSFKGECPQGSACMDAPKDLLSEMVKKVCLYEQSKYEKPAFENPDDTKCLASEDYNATPYMGLTYGACYPPVKNDTCAVVPVGYKYQPQSTGKPNKAGKKTCELVCNATTDCATGRVCIPKPSQILFGMQLQAVTYTGVCLDLDPSSHHNFDFPFINNAYHAQCKETVADGVDFQEFTTTGNKKASICAPKILTGGSCPSTDRPTGSNVTPIAFQGHCQLPCTADTDCLGDTKCLGIKDEQSKFCLYNNPGFYEKPALENPDDTKKCQTYEDYHPTTYLGLTYAACYPTVNKSDTCPDAPEGFKTSQKGDAETTGGMIRCELPCNASTDCANGRMCVPKPSQKLFGMQLQAVTYTGVCLDLDPSSHHYFDSPFELDQNHAKCAETVTDGVEMQEFTIKDNKKASICAPKVLTDGTCPQTDHPTGYKGTPIAFVEHCQLSCTVDTDCVLGTKCLTISIDSKDTKICLYDSPEHYEKPAFDKTGKECHSYEDYKPATYLGLTYGACYPTVSKTDWTTDSCPDAPAGSKTPQQGGTSTKGDRIRCELPCNVDKDCANGRMCVPKPSQILFGMQLQAATYTGVCLDLDPASHHDFDSPYGTDEKDPLKCKETTANGVDIVTFTTTDKKTANICAPKVIPGGLCRSTDHPTAYNGTPTAVQEHCQLPCGSNTDCVGGSLCLTTSIDSKDTKVCLYPPPQAAHNYKEDPYQEDKKEGKCTGVNEEKLYGQTEDNKTVAGCFYRLPTPYITCPARTDTTIKAIEKTFQREKVTYCQLSCATDDDCGTKGAKCLALPDQTPKGDKL